MAKEKSKKPQDNKPKKLKSKASKSQSVGKKRSRTKKNPIALERLKIIQKIRKINRKELKKQFKKKIDLFYKISFSALVLLSIVLFYFIVIVSTAPKSIPYVTDMVNEVLERELGKGTNVRDSSIKFTHYGTLRLGVVGFHTTQSVDGGSEIQDFDIPKIEAEFSLLNLLMMKFYPSKIKIFDPNIIIDNFQRELNQAGESLADRTIVEYQNHTALIIGVLAKVRNGEMPIKDFEIENAKVFYYGKNFRTDILLKKSKIRTSVRGKVLHISSVNKIKFNKKNIDVDFNSNCQLSENNDLKCDVALENFIPESISDLHTSLSILDQINSKLDAVASFSIENRKINNVIFKAEAKEGSFEFLNFFAKKMKFENLSVQGSYDSDLNILNFSDIKAEILSDLPKDHNNFSNANLAMSLMISNLNSDAQKSDFHIRLQNVPNDELAKYWPSGLKGKESRKWVTGHLKGGMVKNAYAKFTLASANLENMDAQVVFADVNLKYHKDFPEIKKISGIANFTKQNMNISIEKGNVLESQIYDSIVAIDDFFAGKKIILKINGKLKGNAADTLKHIDYKSDFALEVEKYLNGNSISDFEIQLPIGKTISLKNSYIAVNSAVAGLNNRYVEGGVVINSKKSFNSDNFVSKIDLTAAEFKAKAFDIYKKSNVESNLSFVVSVANPRNVLIKNILLWKKEGKILSKISGFLRFDTSPFLITATDLKNINFGRNSYLFSYRANLKNSSQSIAVNGSRFDLGSFIKNFKSVGNLSSSHEFDNLSIHSSLSRAYLLRGKMIKGLKLNVKCYQDLCYSGNLYGSYNNNKNNLNLNATKELKDSFATVKGNIENIGYLAEGFGISNLVSDGDVKLDLKNEMITGQQTLSGDLEIKDDITIYETATVKRLAKDDLFSKIKNKIFSSEKTTFDTLKLDFALTKNVLNIRSLIANNYKIGITAKGFVNLKNDSYELKGMIVPGFIINNLFGIGKIPIIGGVISGLLTGGEGGGLFGIKYEYVKKPGQKEPTFMTHKVSSFVPTTIKNLFDLI